MLEILTLIDGQSPCPSPARCRFMLRFIKSVGLCSAELLNAKLADFRLEPEGWVMQVHDKDANNRIAAVLGQAFEALQQYLAFRGAGLI